MSTPAKKTKRKNPQTGKTDVYADKQHKAKKPGKRISATGKTYYERRANRSDIGKLLAPKKEPSPAQLAARKRFSEMAKSGELKKLKATSLKKK